MTTPRIPQFRTCVSVDGRLVYGVTYRAPLACGHDALIVKPGNFEFLAGMLAAPTKVGAVVVPGAQVKCGQCTDDDRVARMKARGQVPAWRFESRDELDRILSLYDIDPGWRIGPLHRWNGGVCVELYLGCGQTEFLDAADTRAVISYDAYPAGFDRTELGWAYVYDDDRI